MHPRGWAVAKDVGRVGHPNIVRIDHGDDPEPPKKRKKASKKKR